MRTIIRIDVAQGPTIPSIGSEAIAACSDSGLPRSYSPPPACPMLKPSASALGAAQARPFESFALRRPGSWAQLSWRGVAVVHLGGLTNISEMSSTSARMMRGVALALGLGPFDSVLQLLGIMMSRISTEIAVTPHCSHFLPIDILEIAVDLPRRRDMSARLAGYHDEHGRLGRSNARPSGSSPPLGMPSPRRPTIRTGWRPRPRDEVGRERRLGGERGRGDALVHVDGRVLCERDAAVQPWAGYG